LGKQKKRQKGRLFKSENLLFSFFFEFPFFSSSHKGKANFQVSAKQKSKKARTRVYIKPYSALLSADEETPKPPKKIEKKQTNEEAMYGYIQAKIEK
jgi:hypothetical protein